MTLLKKIKKAIQEHTSYQKRKIHFLPLLISLFIPCIVFSQNSKSQPEEFGKIYDPLSIYLTWQKSPETTMTVNWITPLDRQDNRLEYRRLGDKNWIQKEASHRKLPQKTPYLLHRIELVDLKPATKYEFKIGKNGLIYKFKTMPENLTLPIRFIAGGDMYHDKIDVLRHTNQLAAKTYPLFALVGGDIAYASNKLFDFLPRWSHPLIDHIVGQKFDRWLTWLIAWKEDMVTPDGYMIPLLPAIGNHDTSGRYGQTPAEAPFFYALFPMPGKAGYQVLDFSNYMSIFLLDSGHTNPIGGKQAEWLSESLKARKEIKRKFALYHVPAYPSVHKLTQEIGEQIRKYWVPSFDTYHLTAAFENHEHAYKRTHPIANGRIDSQGVVYIGDGGWGVSKPRRPKRVSEKWYLAKALSARQFLVIDLDESKQTVTAIDSEGTEIDSFTW